MTGKVEVAGPDTSNSKLLERYLVKSVFYSPMFFINTFHATVVFLHLWFSDVFRGVERQQWHEMC